MPGKTVNPMIPDLMRQRAALSAVRGATRMGAGAGAGADMTTVDPILKAVGSRGTSPGIGIADKIAGARQTGVSKVNPKAVLKSRGKRVATDSPLQRAARRRMEKIRAQ